MTTFHLKSAQCREIFLPIVSSFIQAASRGSTVLVGTDPSRVCRGDFLAEMQRLAAVAQKGRTGSSSLTRPSAPEPPFFEPPVTVALEPVKWKAKRVEVALLNPQLH